jgi:vacuolar-type H+-ATPase subunit H
MAAQAAEQVRGIVEAAERSASEITEGAESEARRIVEEANDRARETREKADRDAVDRVQAAEDATQSVLDRSNTVKSEIDRMLDDARAAADTLASNLRGSAGSLQGELDSIRGELSSVREGRLEAESSASGTASRGVDSDEASAPAMTTGPGSIDADEIDDTVIEEEDVTFEAEETVVDLGTNGDGAAAVEDEEMAEDEGAEEAEEASAPQSSSGGRSIRGAEGARLIALNMALNGTPRDETARYLSQNFDLDDQDALLDEVYARVGD